MLAIIKDVDITEENVEESTDKVDEISLKFLCSLCSFVSSHKHSLQRHIYKKHRTLEDHLPCPRSFCGLTFATRWEKEEHVAGCWLTCQRVECSGKAFSRPDKYQQHLRMHKRMDEDVEE